MQHVIQSQLANSFSHIGGDMSSLYQAFSPDAVRNAVGHVGRVDLEASAVCGRRGDVAVQTESWAGGDTAIATTIRVFHPLAAWQVNARFRWCEGLSEDGDGLPCVVVRIRCRHEMQRVGPPFRINFPCRPSSL